MNTIIEKYGKIKENDVIKCEMCNKFFEAGWDDEDATKESQELFGFIPPEHRIIICDDCFQKLRKDVVI